MSPSASRAPVDRHVLYEAAVQGVEYDLDFFERVYRRLRGGAFTRLREDFCGTAALASAWALRGATHRAWAVDHHAPTLAWARRRRLARLGEAAARVTLVCGDVRAHRAPAVDVACALNFSYWVFRQRDALRAYFRAARRSLRTGGLFFVQVFGGGDAMAALVEKRRVGTTTSIDGRTLPPFTYVWEQRSFNPVDHRLRCAIHFRLRDGRDLRGAFRYDWRMWSLPELRELLAEAGFAHSEVYVEGWDHRRHRPADHYRRRTSFENQSGWLAYVVGVS